MAIPGKIKDYYEKYGITYAEYNLMLRKQHYKCKICKIPEGKKALSVDHNHITGKVRGLLCNNCNSLLGYAKDNPIILQLAIDYLE